jgi:hypothetical protein
MNISASRRQFTAMLATRQSQCYHVHRRRAARTSIDFDLHQNSRVLTPARGKASCIEARHSNVILQCSYQQPSAQLLVDQHPAAAPWRSGSAATARVSRLIASIHTAIAFTTASSRRAVYVQAPDLQATHLTGKPLWLRVLADRELLAGELVGYAYSPTAEAKQKKLAGAVEQRKPMDCGAGTYGLQFLE